MGISLKYPLGKNSSASKLVHGVVKRASNPVGAINKAFGTKIPTSVKIGGTSIGVDPIKQARASLVDLQKAGRQANTDWQNAGKGDVGKVVAATGQQYYNLATAVPRTLKGAATGTLDKENQKTLGAGVSSFFGMNPVVFNAMGTSSTFQREARRESANDWTLGFSKNYAGASRGAIGLSNANLLNEDRNDISQLGVKYAAVAAAGYGISSAFPGAPPPAQGGAVLVETSPIAAEGVVTSSTIFPGASAAAPAAAGGTSWLGMGTNGALAYSLLTGKQAPNSMGDIFTGGGINPPDNSGGLLGPIMDLFNGSDRSPAYVESQSPVAGALAELLPATDEGKMLLWTGLAVAIGYYLWSRNG